MKRSAVPRVFPLFLSDTLLFDRQDLQRELTEDDEKDFSFVPDAIISKQEVIKVTADDEDDEDDELLLCVFLVVFLVS